MKCKNCGAEISAGAKNCEYCGTQISYEMQKEQERLNKSGCPNCGSSNITFDREKQAEIKSKNGTSVVRNTVGLCKDCGFTWAANGSASNKRSNKRSKTWLWVLGWIFVFPIPLTIVMLRKKNMKPVLKYGVIAAVWLIYLLIVVAGGSNKDADSVADGINRGIPQNTETAASSTAADMTQTPTLAPTADPTEKPTQAPTANPTEKPTQAPTPLPTPGEKQNFTVDITWERTDNNGTKIGSNWSYYYELNGKELKKGSTCSISAWDNITIYAKYTENDRNPDVDAKTMTYVVTESEVKNGFIIQMGLSVTENGGTHRGKSADFNITFKFKPKR